TSGHGSNRIVAASLEGNARAIASLVPDRRLQDDGGRPISISVSRFCIASTRGICGSETAIAAEFDDRCGSFSVNGCHVEMGRPNAICLVSRQEGGPTQMSVMPRVLSASIPVSGAVSKPVAQPSG